MEYSIGEVSKKFGLSPSALRYYDKEGLLPFVKRTNGGKRVFDDEDIEWISIIECLKNTGMSVKDIKVYINLCVIGDKTLDKRLEIFKKQKKNVEKQIEDLNYNLEKINRKIWYYDTAVKAGSEDVHENKGCDKAYFDYLKSINNK